MNPVIIDVREADEFECRHIVDSIHLPLSSFSRQAPPVFKTLAGRKVLLMCQSGKRAELAASEAERFDADCEVEIYRGGIQEWIRQGKAVIELRKPGLPIMRQVQLIAGTLVVSGVLLSLFINPSFIYLSAFVGAGLMTAGATGFCGMALLLNQMPWNRNRSKFTSCGT